MFSYSGLSQAAVQRLREEFSVYAIDTGRICVAALNSHNLDYVAAAIARVRWCSDRPVFCLPRQAPVG